MKLNNPLSREPSPDKQDNPNHGKTARKSKMVTGGGGLLQGFGFGGSHEVNLN